MKTLLKNASIVCKDKIIKGGLSIENGKITGLGRPASGADRVLDCRGKFVLPGFVETHIHGIAHFDFQGKNDPQTHAHVDDYDDAIGHIMAYLPKIGITSSLLSTYTVGRHKLDHFFREAKKYKAGAHPGHARFHGIDMEGNFLKDPVYAGAQDAEKILVPGVELFEELQEICGGLIVKALIAPEWGECAFTLIRHMAKKGLVPSVGHTGCTREELLKAYECGTRATVHTGNGPMSQNFKYGGALDGIFELGPKLYGEIICDFKHVHPRWINTFLKCFGPDHSVAVSDAGSTTCAGLKDGDELGGLVVRDGALWVKAKQNTLAGSITPLSGDFNNMVNLLTSDRKAYFQEKTDKPLKLDEALPRLSRMFSLNGAALLGLDRELGSLSKGKQADLIVADIKGAPGKYRFSIEKVFIAGAEALS